MAGIEAPEGREMPVMILRIIPVLEPFLKLAPLSDLQKEALTQARTLNATLPVDFQVSAPRGLNKAAVAGKFIKSVGNAAVSAHKDLKV